jgi:hypothetical protein
VEENVHSLLTSAIKTPKKSHNYDKIAKNHIISLKIHTWGVLPNLRTAVFYQRSSPLFTFTAGGGCTGGLGYQRRAGLSFLQR